MNKARYLIGLALFFGCLVPLCALARGNPNAVPGPVSQPVYDEIIVELVDLPMRDGVNMRIVVARPDAPGQFPVLLHATPYGADRISGRRDGADWASRGYVWVSRNVRGRYASEGEFINLHLQEINDQYDTIDWLADQPWSNGKIATIGKSYPGQTALFAAVSGHPNLVCAQAQFTGENVWRDGWYYRGGALEQGFLTNWLADILGRDTGKRILPPGPEREAWLDALARFKADPVTANLVMPLVDFEATQLGPDYNLLKILIEQPGLNSYWVERNVESYISSINIPILHVASWYDSFLNGSILTWQDIKAKGLTANARDNQRLFIYTQTHIWDEHTIDLGLARLDISVGELTLAFFDYWLKDVQTPLFDPDNSVTYYTMGEQVWRHSDTWPPPSEPTPFYFSSARHDFVNDSFQSLNNGSLSRQSPTSAVDSQSYVYDPMQPIPTLGGNTLGLFAYTENGSDKSGAQPQNYVDSVSLTYTTQPLAEPLEITGQIRAVLYVASDAVDTDFIVRLNDVGPDGVSHNLADGIIRARWRNSSVSPQLLVPGEIYELEIDLWSTSHVFLPGHSIRVTVNSSSFPRWSRNMNIAEQPELATDWAVANNTIYLDAEHPSHIILPVVSR